MIYIGFDYIQYELVIDLIKKEATTQEKYAELLKNISLEDRQVERVQSKTPD